MIARLADPRDQAGSRAPTPARDRREDAGGRRAKHWQRLALALVIISSAALATVWVFLVPIFEAADETVHFDYALLINANRGLLRATHAKFDEYPVLVHPYSYHLVKHAEALRVAHWPGRRMSPGYGTRAFYRTVDATAPAWDARTLRPDSLRERLRAQDRRIPAWDPRQVEPNNLIAVNPYGYYATLALWVEGLRCISDRPVFLFFGCRLFSVLLLVCTLCLVGATARRLRLPSRRALALTAAVGLFPMTTFVASYVQPDNLAFTLVLLAGYLALRCRDEPRGLTAAAGLGLTLGALLVTKPHFFLCAAVPCAALLAVEVVLRRVPRGAVICLFALLVAPSFLTGSLQLWTVRGATNIYHSSQVSHGLLHTLQWFGKALQDYYGGLTHDSFSGIFGWLDTPLVIGGGHTSDVVRYGIAFISWPLVGLTLVRLEQVCSRLVRLSRRGRWRAALRISVSNPLVNGYFLFTALMFYLYVHLENRFGAQGRNWLPFVPAMVLVATGYAPKALTLRRSRAVVAAAVTGALLLYCLVGSYYSITSIHKRYYVPVPGGLEGYRAHGPPPVGLEESVCVRMRGVGPGRR